MKTRTPLCVLSLVGLVIVLAWVTGCATRSASPSLHPVARPIARHLLLIGLDGARADAIRDHAGPTLRSLIEHGTVCWQAQAVKPSVTQVNWPSILTGCLPATHGADMNPVTEQQLSQVKLKVPTLFDLVASHGGTAAGFLGHWKLYTCDTHTKGAVTFHSPYQTARVADEAAKYIVANRPTFCFVYFGDLDGIGHRQGWMSPAYLDALSTIDAGVAKLLDALTAAGMRQDTVVLLTADHGGTGKSHSSGTPEDTAIPWIACGPGVAVGKQIHRAVSTTDTAPTILALLGLPIPTQCDGAVVREALPPTTDQGQSSQPSQATDNEVSGSANGR